MNFKLLESVDNDILDFNFNEDISIMTEILNMSKDELFEVVGIDNIDSKDNIDKLYDYCYARNLYVNDIKWQEYREIFNNSFQKIFCHGSKGGIKGPIRLDANGPSNDFEKGFYIGETLKQAGMYVASDPNACIYLMLFNPIGLKSIKFNVDTYWMLAIAYYRGLLDNYLDNPLVKSIVNRVDACDYIIAPIADNRIFQLIDAFMEGELTDKQTLYALSAIHLGMQYVLKTPKALECVTPLDRCYVCPIERSYYNKQNYLESNTSLNKAKYAKYRYKDKGQYVYELLGKSRI